MPPSTAKSGLVSTSNTRPEPGTGRNGYVLLIRIERRQIGQATVDHHLDIGRRQPRHRLNHGGVRRRPAKTSGDCQDLSISALDLPVYFDARPAAADPAWELSFGCPHSIRRCSMRSKSTDSKPAMLHWAAFGTRRSAFDVQAALGSGFLMLALQWRATGLVTERRDSGFQATTTGRRRGWPTRRTG